MQRKPGIGAIAFSVSDYKGDFLYAKAEALGKTTNIKVEALAIRVALYHCQEQGLL